MNKGSGISYIHDRIRPDNHPSAARIHLEIKEISVSLVMDSLCRMFDGIDDSFFELANHAHTNNEQNRFFEAMREIRLKRKGIETTVQSTLFKAFEHPEEINEDHPTSKKVEFDELSLVQNDALEESVAIDSMITKAKANYAGSLIQFQSRFSHLLTGHENSTVSFNPLEPAILCKSFGKACEALEIGIKEKLIVFKQFDRHVMEHLVEPLEECNQHLIKAGILPDLKYPSYTNTYAEKSSPTNNIENKLAESSPKNTMEYNHPPEEDILAQAQVLLASLRPEASSTSFSHFNASATSGLSHEYSGPPITLPENELVSRLSNSQSNAETDNLAKGQAVIVDIRSIINAILDEKAQTEERPAELNQVDEDIINLVAMLFEFILDDYNLSAPIQVLISRLQIPILKVAIKDKSFFSKPSHPARKLLNSLARAGVGWAEATDKSKDKLYDKIHDIVQQILNDEECDLAFYEQLNQEFNQHISKEEKKSRIVEQRTKEAEIGKVKSQKARLVVDRILYEKISSTAIPQIALDLLRNGWSRVMFLIYLKEGKGHRFSQCVKLVDEFIWCLQVHTEEEDRKRWVQVVPKLLKGLKMGLKEVSYNSGQLDEPLLALKKELTQTFKQQSHAASLIEPPNINDLKSAIEAAEQKQLPVSDASLYEHLEKVDLIQPGDWVEFSLVNGSRFRCKFSTFINESDSLVFVNRMGLKVVEKTRIELAEELRKGQMTILDSGLLMDRAIDTVMHNLKKMSDKVA